VTILYAPDIEPESDAVPSTRECENNTESGIDSVKRKSESDRNEDIFRDAHKKFKTCVDEYYVSSNESEINNEREVDPIREVVRDDHESLISNNNANDAILVMEEQQGSDIEDKYSDDEHNDDSNENSENDNRIEEDTENALIEESDEELSDSDFVCSDSEIIYMDENPRDDIVGNDVRGNANVVNLNNNNVHTHRRHELGVEFANIIMEYERMKNELRGTCVQTRITYDRHVEIYLLNIDACIEYTLTGLRKMDDEIDIEREMLAHTSQIITVARNANQIDIHMIIPRTITSKSKDCTPDYNVDFDYYTRFQRRMDIYNEDNRIRTLNEVMTDMTQILTDTEDYRTEIKSRPQIIQK